MCVVVYDDSGVAYNKKDILDLALTRRWTAFRKGVVVRAVCAKLITVEEALTTFNLSREELDFWINEYSVGGPKNLRVTKYKRRPAAPPVARDILKL